mgnify:FL=1
MIRKPTGPVIRYNGQKNFYGCVDALVLSQHSDRLDADSRACLDHHRIAPAAREVEIEMPPRFVNTLSSQGGSAGNFAVPTGFISGWVKAQSALNVVRSLSTVHPVDRGGDWHLPTTTDSALEGELIAAEATAGTASDISFGSRVFRLKKFMSRPTKVPAELEADGDTFAQQLGESLGEQVARIQNRTYTATMTREATAVSAASATAIANDDLLNLLGGVGGSYLDTQRSAFMLSKTVLITLLKLKDGQGRPVVPIENGRIHGYRYYVNDHMSATITSGDRTILFGSFDAFHIAETSLRLQTAYEAFADSDQILYRAAQRADGGIANASDNPIAILVQ